MKKLIVFLLLLSWAAPVPVHAEISPVIVHLQTTPQRPILTFDVPEGKILVIEHIWGSSFTGIDVTVDSTKFKIPMQPGTLAISMKFGSEWHLQAPISTATEDIFLLGYIADPKDLSGGISQAGNILSGIEVR